MGGSIQKTRKDMRKGADKPSQPVQQHTTGGAKPKSMTSGVAKPASAWKK